MKKIKVNDFLILLFLYIAISSLPFDLIIENNFLIISLQIIVRIGYSIFAIYYLKKLGLFNNQKSDISKLIIFLPVYIVCFSNIFVGLFTGSLNGAIDWKLLSLKFVLSFATSLAEELLFRDAAFDLFPSKKPLTRVILCACIFGGSHIINIIPSFNPTVLLQVLYTFGIGLLIGLIYEYTANLVACILFHFIFNGINSDLFAMIYSGSIDWIYYLVNVMFALVIGLYCLFIYLSILRKVDQN